MPVFKTTYIQCPNINIALIKNEIMLQVSHNERALAGGHMKEVIQHSRHKIYWDINKLHFIPL